MGNLSSCCEDEADAAAKSRAIASEKQRMHLNHASSVLVTVCSAEFTECVMRVFFTELTAAVDLIGAAQKDPPIDALSNPTAYVTEIVNTADLETFVNVESARGLQRIQLPIAAGSSSSSTLGSGGGSSKPTSSSNSTASFVAAAAASGTMGAGSFTGVTTSLKSRSGSKISAVEDYNLDTLAAHNSGGGGGGDGGKAAAEAKSRLLRIWSDAQKIYSSPFFHPHADRVKLIRAWILMDHAYSGSMAIPLAQHMIASISGMHPEASQHLVKFLERINKRAIDPKSNVTFSEIWTAFQEYALQWPELCRFWAVVEQPWKQREWAEAEAKCKKQQQINNEEWRAHKAEEEKQQAARGSYAAMKARPNRASSHGPLQVTPLDFMPEIKMLSKSDIVDFLVMHQVGQFKTMSAAKQYAENVLAFCGGCCDQDAFCRFLTNPELNGPLNNSAKTNVWHDMTQPITHYFISASCKTFLTGPSGNNNNNNSKSSSGAVSTTTKPTAGGATFDKVADESMFKTVLLDGCRCIELELWDDISSPSASLPVVWHNPSANCGNDHSDNNHQFAAAAAASPPASKINLNSALSAIAECAFAASSFPLIIVLSVHVKSAEQQQGLAAALRKVFGTALVVPTWQPGDPLAGIDFTPKALLNKVLLMARRGCGTQRDLERQQALDARATINRMHAPAYARTTFDPTKNVARAHANDLTNLCPQLAQLIALDTFGGVVDIAKPVPPNVYHYHCTIEEEQKALGYAAKYESQTMSTTAAQLVYVRPEMSRQLSSNMHPQSLWNAGVQMPAMAWHDGGYETRLYKRKFALDNGACGFLLKPKYLTATSKFSKPLQQGGGGGGGTQSGNGGVAESEIESYALTVEVLSALNLPDTTTLNAGTRHARQRVVRNPHVYLKIEGPYLETNAGRTHTVTIPVLPESELEANGQPFLQVQRSAASSANQLLKMTENTFHPVYSPPPSLLPQFNRNSVSNCDENGERKTASQIVADRDDAAKRQHLLTLYKNTMQVQVPVPYLSTLVIQIVDTGAVLSPAAAAASTNNNNSNNNNSTAAAAAALKKKKKTNHLSEPLAGVESSLSAAAAFGSFSGGGGGPVVIAEAFLPVHLMHQGVRCVQLCRPDASMEPIPDCRLMIAVKKGESKSVTRDSLSLSAINTLGGSSSSQQDDVDFAELEAMVTGAGVVSVSPVNRSNNNSSSSHNVSVLTSSSSSSSSPTKAPAAMPLLTSSLPSFQKSAGGGGSLSSSMNPNPAPQKIARDESLLDMIWGKSSGDNGGGSAAAAAAAVANSSMAVNNRSTSDRAALQPPSSQALPERADDLDIDLDADFAAMNLEGDDLDITFSKL